MPDVVRLPMLKGGIQSIDNLGIYVFDGYYFSAASQPCHFVCLGNFSKVPETPDAFPLSSFP